MAKKVLTPEEVKAKLEKRAAKRELFFGTFTKALALFLVIAIAWSLAAIAFAPAVNTGVNVNGNVSTNNNNNSNNNNSNVNTPSGDTNTPSGDTNTPSGDANTPSGDANTPSGDADANALTEAIKAVNTATKAAAKGNYHWERESYYTKALDVSGKDALNRVIGMVDKSGTATVESVVGGFLDITGEGNKMTADVKGGKLAVGMKDKDKFLLIGASITESDVKTYSVDGNKYVIELNPCNKPQKDGKNALSHVTNDFITCDEVNQGLADAGAGSLIKANDIDVTFKSIVVTAEIVDGKLVKYDISYTMDVASMDLTALGMVSVSGSGAGVMKCSYTNIKY